MCLRFCWTFLYRLGIGFLVGPSCTRMGKRPAFFCDFIPEPSLCALIALLSTKNYQSRGRTMGIIKIECPSCNQHYSVDVSFVGQKVECSVCGNSFTLGSKNVISWDATHQPLFKETKKPQEKSPSPIKFADNRTSIEHAEKMPPPHEFRQFANEMPQNPRVAQQQVVYIQVPSKAKNRGIYVMLGLFFGTLGVHDFYAGHIARGVAHFCLGIWFFFGFLVRLSRAEDAIDVSFAFLLLLIVFLVNYAWGIIELIRIKKDGKGIPME